MKETMNDTPLEKIRVLDLTHYIAGPYCTKLFAGLGADVIKIEKPGTGDGARWLAPFCSDEVNPEKSALFLYLNTNKRSVILNLKTADGIRRTKELVQEVDILVENFKPGVMAHLGIDYPVLQRINPRLVMTSISNFGQYGPYRDWEATDLIFNALSGMMHLTGRLDREPVKLALSQVQYSAGAAAAIATLAAYRHQQMTGYGQYIDISIVEPFFNMLHQQFSKYAYQGAKQFRESAAEFPFYFESKDGWVHASRLQAGQLIDFFANPKLEDPKFCDSRNQSEFTDIIAPWFKERSKFEAFELAQLQGLMFAPAHTEEDLLKCPQFEERKYFITIDHPVAGRGTYPGKYFVSDQINGPPTKPAPLLGQHTEELAKSKQGEPKQKTQEPEVGKQTQPLAGIRILSTEHWAALPHGTKYLASLGAEVITVESAGHPVSNFPARTQPIDAGIYNDSFRNKRSISLDLTKPEGVELFKRLVKISDVVVDNFTPRVMTNFGLGYESLRKVKDDIIVMSLSGYGHKGPWFLYRGYSVTAESASGLANLTGYKDGPPIRPGGTPPGDIIPALHAVWVLLATLEYHRRTGKGAFIDIGMLEPCTNQIGEAIVAYSVTGKAGERIGNRDLNASPSGCYPCRGDDNWITIAVSTETQWKALAKLMNKPQWTKNKHFATMESRMKYGDELDAFLSEWTKPQDKMELMKVCQEAGVPAGAVLSIREVYTNEHFMKRACFEVVRYPPPPEGVGDALHIGPPWKLSSTPANTTQPAPAKLGTYNDYVYKELLEMKDEELAELDAKGVIATVPKQSAPTQAAPTQGILANLTYRGLYWPLDVAFDPDFKEALGFPTSQSKTT